MGSLTLFIGIYFIYWKLPFTVNRSSDIKLGEKIIKNIENYNATNVLPDNDDWKTLRGFGFRDKIDFLQPEYRRVDKETFELIYVESFDGPYLMWNSTEKKWKEGYPTFPKKNRKTTEKRDITAILC
jgi:hypothetical protein